MQWHFNHVFTFKQFVTEVTVLSFLSFKYIYVKTYLGLFSRYIPIHPTFHCVLQFFSLDDSIILSEMIMQETFLIKFKK